MVQHPDYQTMTLLLRRQKALPALPADARHLIELTGMRTSPELVEKAIYREPRLTSDFMWLAFCELDQAESAVDDPVKAMMSAVGIEAVKYISLSLSIYHFMSETEMSPAFDLEMFLKHSAFVARMAARIAKDQNLRREELNWGNVFATAMLHDLPLWTLAKVFPQCYSKVYVDSQQRSLSLERSFAHIHGASLSSLGEHAVSAWNLPKIYKIHFDSLDSSDSLAKACIQRAKQEAEDSEFPLETWTHERARQEGLLTISPDRLLELKTPLAAELQDFFAMAEAA